MLKCGYWYCMCSLVEPIWASVWFKNKTFLSMLKAEVWILSSPTLYFPPFFMSVRVSLLWALSHSPSLHLSIPTPPGWQVGYLISLTLRLFTFLFNWKLYLLKCTTTPIGCWAVWKGFCHTAVVFVLLIVGVLGHSRLLQVFHIYRLLVLWDGVCTRGGGGMSYAGPPTPQK